MNKNKPTVEELIQEARNAQLAALAPHSNYSVGAAILTSENYVVTGFNIESKVYPSTMCAERVAIFSALAQGYSSFSAIAVITDDGGMPCGSCLQLIHEFLGEIPIYIANKTLSFNTFTTRDLLPYPFG